MIRYCFLIGLLIILFPISVFGWWEIWPYNDHQAITSKAIDIAGERWPEMAEEINNYRDEMKQGSHDEDFGSDTLYGNSSDYSAYSPTLPQAYWPLARLHLNALEWIRAWQNPYSWDRAVSWYGSNQSAAYLALGHVLHNLQDLFVPAHSFVAPHGLGTGGLVYNHSWPFYFDNFEQYCEVTANELNRSDPNRIPEVLSAPESLMVQAAIFATQDQESLNYFPNQYYAPPDSVGDWGKYRPYPYQGYPSGIDNITNDIANAWSLFLVPRCVEYTAGMIRLFYCQFHTALKDESKKFNTKYLSISNNPFNRYLKIKYSVSSGSEVYLRIIDKTGRRVKVLDKGFKEPKEYEIIWDGTNTKGELVAPGIYFALLSINNQSISKQIIKLF
jgi:predicted CopG family antitoxin